MEDKDLYYYSKSLGILEKKISKLKNLHIYRYSKFVDTSKRGLACSMARTTKTLLPEEHEDFLSLLKDLKDTITLFEDKYKDEIVNEEKKEK